MRMNSDGMWIIFCENTWRRSLNGIAMYNDMHSIINKHHHFMLQHGTNIVCTIAIISGNIIKNTLGIRICWTVLSI